MKGAGKLFEIETKNGLKHLENQKLLTYSKNEALGGRWKRIPRLKPDFYVFTKNGKFIYIENKSTQNKTRFPFANIKSHQIRELRRISKWPNGYGLFFINFRSRYGTERSKQYNESYIVTVDQFFKYREKTGRDSFERDWIRENCLEVKSEKLDIITQSGKQIKVNSWKMDFLLNYR